MTPVEIIALVLVIVGVIKVIVLMIKPSAWLGTFGKMWVNTPAFLVVAVILALVVLRYLLTELTIVQIFAVFAFMAPFYWIALAPYRREIYEMVSRDTSTKTLFQKSWFTMLIWVVLSVWVLMEIF